MFSERKEVKMNFVLYKHDKKWRLDFWKKDFSQNVLLTKKELSHLKWLVETELMTDDLNREKGKKLEKLIK
uniref:Uncharacterized protein n=1 Tax=viral metagenome TaxID=1070528 RepID=A0A6H2A2P5_9ZZZZ